MDYRVYFMSKGHIQQVVEFICDDDAEAIRIADALDDDRTKELWNLARKVRTFPGRGEPSPPDDGSEQPGP